MTERELIRKALNNEELKRVPWVPYTGVQIGQLTGYNAAELLQDGEKLFKSLVEAEKQYSPDGMPVIFNLQIEAADLVLINKCDLVKESEISSFESVIKKINPNAQTCRTVQANADMALLSGAAHSNHRGNIESCNIPANRPGSIQLEPAGIARKNLDAFLHDQLENT